MRHDPPTTPGACKVARLLRVSGRPATLSASRESKLCSLRRSGIPIDVANRGEGETVELDFGRVMRREDGGFLLNAGSTMEREREGAKPLKLSPSQGLRVPVELCCGKDGRTVIR